VTDGPERPFAELLAAGREALANRKWDEARACFERAVREDETPEAHEGLGWAAWYADDAEAIFQSRARAYQLFRRRGDRRGAARMAIWSAVDYLEFRGEFAVANGWFRRAHRLLDGLEPCAEHGWLALHEAAIAVEFAGDGTAGRDAGRQAAELGSRLGETDLEMVGIAVEGLALICDGEVAEGMQRLDESAAAALAGELESPFAVGWCCCYLIFGCERVRDHERAAQWCEEVERLAERLHMRYLFRVCRTHHAGVLVGHGAWEEAEAQLAEANEQLLATRPSQAAEGIVRLAELRRRQGRLEEAAQLFEGVEPHPLAIVGGAAVALEEGDVAGAIERLERFLRHLPEKNRSERPAALELLIEARAAEGDLPKAREALSELAAVGKAMGTAHLFAATHYAEGVVAAAGRDHARARDAFEHAVELFGRSSSPFEQARSRRKLAQVLLILNHKEAAAREARAALREADALGAELERERARTLLEEAEAGVTEGEADAGGGLTPRELEILRLVAAGLNDAQIAERLVVSEHTVHRHVANVRTKLRVPSRSAAVARAARDGLL
jgi:LuxR family maltose regulon positive regulatory protein